MSFIDILILTYNNLSAIKTCINNIYRYTSLNNFQLFILDNDSHDGTVEYLKEIKNQYNNVYINFQQKNHGIIKGRNKCFDFSKEISDSKYIIFLDSDQYVQKGWLESYLKMIKSFDIISSEAWKMNKQLYPYKRITNHGESFSYVGCGSMMMKKGIFEKLGKFDEIFSPMFFEDPDFIFRADKEEYKIGWNYKYVIRHDHKGSLLTKKTKQHFIRSWKKFREKWRGIELPIFKM